MTEEEKKNRRKELYPTNLKRAKELYEAGEDVFVDPDEQFFCFNVEKYKDEFET